MGLAILKYYLCPEYMADFSYTEPGEHSPFTVVKTQSEFFLI